MVALVRSLLEWTSMTEEAGDDTYGPAARGPPNPGRTLPPTPAAARA